MDAWYLPSIDLLLCTGCGVCAAECPAQAVAMIFDRPVIERPQDCAYCGRCEEICPTEAIVLRYQIVPRHTDSALF